MIYIVTSFDHFNTSEVRVHCISAHSEIAHNIYDSVVRINILEHPNQEIFPIVELTMIENNEFSDIKGELLFWGDDSNNRVTILSTNSTLHV